MDGTENQKDTSQVTGDTSGGDKGTSEQTPETFTKDQRDKAVSDALSSAGRDAKALETIRTKLEKATEELVQTKARWHKEKDEEELDKAGDDKDALSRVRARQEQREVKAKLAKAEQELEGEREKVKEVGAQTQELERTQKAAEIAVKHGVDFNTLVKFTDGSPKAMEELAQTLTKKGEAPEVKLDSGKTTGVEKSDEQKLKEMYPLMD